MFGFTKKQKIDQKMLIMAFDSALNNFQSATSTDSLLAETGKSRQELLDAVMVDDEVESCREDMRTAILAKSWRIWGEGVSEDIINQLYKIIRKHANTFAELAILARFAGFSVAEYVFKQEKNGFLTLDKVLSKDGELDKYTPKRDGTVILKTDNEEVEINQHIKYLVLTSKAVPSRPSGEMMIIRAYPAVAMRKREWAYAGQFIARYAQPYVVGKQGGYGSIKDFTNTIFGFINGGATGIGKDDEISIHQLSGNGEAFELIERLANRRIQKLILGRVKTSELTSGSRSAQETEEETRQDRITAYLDLMTQAIQHAIDAIITVNQHYGLAIHAPRGIWFEYEQQTKVDLNRAERDKIYCDTGQIQLTKDYMTTIVGYEENHIEMIGNQQSMIHLTLSQDNHLNNNKKIMQGKINAILDLLNNCDSYTEYEQKLSNLDLTDDGLITDLAKQSTDAYLEGLLSANDSIR